MKIIKITSLGCPSCIIMNKVFNKLKSNFNFEYEEYDYDFDDIEKYKIGEILPVYIFYNDDIEIARLNGEHKYEELERILLDNEKNS